MSRAENFVIFPVKLKYKQVSTTNTKTNHVTLVQQNDTFPCCTKVHDGEACHEPHLKFYKYMFVL